MADIKLNFSSQWPSLQVVKVLPTSSSEWGVDPSDSSVKRAKHGLDFPPLCISYLNGLMDNVEVGLEMDKEYVYYIDDEFMTRADCIIVYNIDISKEFIYPNSDSFIGEIPKDSSTDDTDMRDFLLHSRTVAPMLYSIVTKEFSLGDLTMTYTHDLGYPIFNFGFLYMDVVGGMFHKDRWMSVPLAGQAWPVMPTDGITSSITSFATSGTPDATKGSIVTLRNPYIISNNTTSVTI